LESSGELFLIRENEQIAHFSPGDGLPRPGKKLITKDYGWGRLGVRVSLDAILGESPEEYISEISIKGEKEHFCLDEPPGAPRVAHRGVKTGGRAADFLSGVFLNITKYQTARGAGKVRAPKMKGKG